MNNKPLLLSPSDLNRWVECEHLLQLELAARRGERARLNQRSEQADLIAAKGDAHERQYLDSLRSRGLAIVEIDQSLSFENAAAQTIVAMRERVDVIYQATFVHDQWRGRADFIVRVDAPSALGDWSYEVEDTKLARQPKPHFLLQLCFYSDQVARIQGRDPELMHVVLGDSERAPFRYDDFSAYFRRVRNRFMGAVADRPATSPYPVAHCEVCNWVQTCEDRWRSEDHLTLIPFMRRDHTRAFAEAGVRTVAQLAAYFEPLLEGVSASPLAAHQHHARLQISARATGNHIYELLPFEAGRGLARLPEPSPGDLFFDMEGDPFFQAAEGLEYLFGISTLDTGEPRFQAFWAHNRQQEKTAFESTIDFVAERRRRWPMMHVYHYAAYEPSAMARLMGRHGTREDALDDLLRHHVFVDLYSIVRQSMRTSLPGYSIKQVRTLFMADFGHDGVVDAGDSIVAYERWCESHDAGDLQAIAEYNERDCLSNLRLRDWLLECRGDAERQCAVTIPWFTEPEPPGPAEHTIERRARQSALEGALQEIAGRDVDEFATSASLLAALIQYHRREAVPEWAAFFRRLEASEEDLHDDPEAISALEPTGETEQAKKSVVHTLAFPPQEHKLSAGPVIDPRTGESAGELVEVNDRLGLLKLKRGPKLRDVQLPRAIISGKPIPTEQQEEALIRVAAAAVADGLERLPYTALADILLRRPPRIRGITQGQPIQTTDLDLAKRYVQGLADSYLFIQGPPGTGKTWRGARLIVDLLAAGKRVGITAQSHKVIHNLLREVRNAAVERHITFHGLKKASKGDEDTWYEDEFVTSVDDNAPFEGTPEDIALVAGTAWLFSRAGMERSLDYLFIDEAGQIALADALAVGTAARNLVLLGDPLQLAQVSTGSHPAGAQQSVLEHLLGPHATIPEHKGLFLEESRRMHPNVCRFISDVIYRGRLRSESDCVRQQINCEGWPAAGIRFRPVEHSGNSQRSVEEADAIANDVAELVVGARFTDQKNQTRRLTHSDVLVVAAYNQQVRCLRDRLPAAVRVGTVDKFQGQEAPVVFFSMACSSADEIPRGLEFLFSRNRLNVAVSRAQCIATVVASPRLLDALCRTPEQMRLVNALCRFVELCTV